MSDITDRARELACKITGIDVDQIEDYGLDEIASIARIAEAALQRERDEAYAAGYNAEQGDLAEILRRERDKAAERLRILREALGMAIHVAVNFGRDHPAIHDLLAGASKVYDDSAAIRGPEPKVGEGKA